MGETRRRLIVREDDVLVVGGYELAAAVLKEIVDPDRRLLWAFEKSDDGSAILPQCYAEDRVLWLSSRDLERTKDEVKDLCKE